jgi:type IV pilus assembly protein PilA
MQRLQRGFSLIELLIVVAIILVIAAIAIPNFLRSRIAANETAAVSSLRTIKTAQITYAASYPTVGFAPDLATLGPPAAGAPPTSAAADLLDTVLAQGRKSGYGFQSTGAIDGCGSPDAQFVTTTLSGIRVSFAIFACPISQNRTGLRNFCTDDTGVLRQAADANTVCDFTASSPPIQ